MPANGSMPESPIPPFKLTPEFEEAEMRSFHLPVARTEGPPQEGVFLIISLPGRTVQVTLKPDDAIRWGGDLMQQGKAAKLGLIL